jgi:hypothetical protein
MWWGYGLTFFIGFIVGYAICAMMVSVGGDFYDD